MATALVLEKQQLSPLEVGEDNSKLEILSKIQFHQYYLIKGCDRGFKVQILSHLFLWAISAPSWGF